MALVQSTTFGQFAADARSGGLIPSLDVGSGGGPPRPGAVTLPPVVGKIIGQILVSDVKSRFSTGTDPRGSPWRPLKFKRPNGGDKPLRDTGELMASITARVEPTAVVVGTMRAGAALHNFGGVVRAKGKMLAIPLTKEAKRSGGPRRFQGKLTFQPTKKRRVFLLVGAPPREAKGKKKPKKPPKRVPQFMLVDQVTVPQREFMGVSDKALGYIGQTILDAQARGWLDKR